LLAWSPRLLVHTQALAEVLPWGVKLDAICGTDDKLRGLAPNVLHQQPLELLPLSAPGKLDEVLQWLADRKQANVNVSFPPFEQAPELWNVIWQHRELISAGVLSGGWQYFFVVGKFSKWLPANAVFRVISYSNYPCQADAQATIKEHHTAGAGMLSLEREYPFWVGWPV
jgi:hypothetical protein